MGCQDASPGGVNLQGDHRLEAMDKLRNSANSDMYERIQALRPYECKPLFRTNFRVRSYLDSWARERPPWWALCWPSGPRKKKLPSHEGRQRNEAHIRAAPVCSFLDHLHQRDETASHLYRYAAATATGRVPSYRRTRMTTSSSTSI